MVDCKKAIETLDFRHMYHNGGIGVVLTCILYDACLLNLISPSTYMYITSHTLQKRKPLSLQTLIRFQERLASERLGLGLGCMTTCHWKLPRSAQGERPRWL